MGIAAGDSAARSGRSCACTAGVRIEDGFTLPSTQPLHQGTLPTTRFRIRCGRGVRPIRALISIARVVALARQSRLSANVRLPSKADVCAATNQNVVGHLVGWTHTFAEHLDERRDR